MGAVNFVLNKLIVLGGPITGNWINAHSNQNIGILICKKRCNSNVTILIFYSVKAICTSFH